MTIRIEITQSSSPDYWYADSIGQEFDVYKYLPSPIEPPLWRLVEFPDRTIVFDDARVIDTITTQGDPTYLRLLDEMKQLHIAKNAGYSGDSPDRWANFRLSETFGVSPFLGVMVRMSDKWIRITNLIKNPKNDKVGESIRDTLMDLASYALIAICILSEDKEK